jgi:hypothetical protein
MIIEQALLETYDEIWTARGRTKHMAINDLATIIDKTIKLYSN